MLSAGQCSRIFRSSYRTGSDRDFSLAAERIEPTQTVTSVKLEYSSVYTLNLSSRTFQLLSHINIVVYLKCMQLFNISEVFFNTLDL